MGWHFGVTLGKRKTIRLFPGVRVTLGFRKHFGRPQRRRRRR